MDQIAAGWYLYGADGQQRYWDGTAWTEAAVSQSSTQPQPTRGPPRALLIAGIASIVLGAALLIGAVFAPWYQDTSSLASDSFQLAFNLPSMVLAGAAVGLCLFRSTRTAAGLVALLVGVWVAIQMITAISGTGWHLGQALSVGAAVTLVLGGIGCLVTGGFAIKVDVPAVAWAAGGAVLAGLWIAGEWLPWQRWTYLYTPVGSTQVSEISHWDCCVPFQNGSVPANIREAATMLTLLVGSILLALVWRRTTSGVGLAALGLLYLSSSVSWVVNLADPTISREALLLLLKISPQQADSLNVTGTTSGLIGGWLATIAAIALVILGVMRLLAAVAAPSRATPSPAQVAEPGRIVWSSAETLPQPSVASDVSKPLASSVVSPRHFALRVLLTILLWIGAYLVAGLVGLAASGGETQGSSTGSGIGTLLLLAEYAWLARKVSYRWFDFLFAMIPIYGFFWMLRITWRIAYLPFADWTPRPEEANNWVPIASTEDGEPQVYRSRR